jgi:hypothetical protein
MEQNQEDAALQQEPSYPNRQRRIITFIALGAIALILIFLAAFALFSNKPTETSGQSEASKLFYDMLAAASTKTKAQLTYVQQDFNTKADLDAKKSASQQYSVAELDSASKKYRAVYANQLGPAGDQYYTVRRCLDGKMFKPDVFALSLKTVEDVKKALTQPFVEVAADSTETEDCDVTNPDRLGRVTDGVIPVGLTQQQAESLQRNIQEANFVVIEDAGQTTYQQKSVRKLNITTNSIAGAANFYDSAQKSGVGTDTFRFEEMATTDNIHGFYLIDEQTKLPVYSEFTSVGLRNSGKKGSVIKQIYAYPEALTLTQTSTINTLE